MTKNMGWGATIIWFCLLAATMCWAQEETDSGGWPREIQTSQGVVVIYQPQPEKLEDNRLKGRVAVALEVKGSAEPVFGALWFEAVLDTDRSERMATITDITVTDVRFPEEDEEKSRQLTRLLEKEIPKWQLPISMDRLLTTLDLAEKRSQEAEKINTDPPKIVFIQEPAVLVSLDGEPRLKKEEDSEIMRVINTPFTMLFVPSEKTYYLYADVDTWYAANDILGDWTLAKKVPPAVAPLAPKAEPGAEATETGDDEEKVGPAPKVIVSTEPTELISSKGKPEYTPISGTDLLYMSNTDSDVLMDIGKKKYYVLLSGRWYSSLKLDGPWEYVPGWKLPKDFVRIPEDSEMGTVLYAVPGTDVAKEAVLDAQIPQTAAVDRKKAKLTVEYDGDPKFEKIKSTTLTYAVNTPTPVIGVDKKFYACDEAVWFEGDNATGPWRVATSVPKEIYTIPSDCPIYHVTFVRIYYATDDVVYVGYTPGYTNTYVYHNTIVYGTGYWWPGWYGRWYYPRPATWGFHVRWNPWSGWGFGLSYCNGPFRFTIGVGGWYRGGWWGPGRYRGYRRGYRHGYRRGHSAGYRAGYRSGRHSAAQQNLYQSQHNQNRMSAKATTGSNRAKANAASKRSNNVYADQKGNIHRKTDQGWQTRTNQGWQSDSSQRQDKKQSKQSVQGSKPSTTTQQLDRSSQARQRGDQRSTSYNKARKSSSARSGGSRGGGSRGRGGGRGGRR